MVFSSPLITWIMKITILCFGLKNIDLQLIFVYYFFFVLALWFIYKLGEQLKNKNTGFISAILFCLHLQCI